MDFAKDFFKHQNRYESTIYYTCKLLGNHECSESADCRKCFFALAYIHETNLRTIRDLLEDILVFLQHDQGDKY